MGKKDNANLIWLCNVATHWISECLQVKDLKKKESVFFFIMYLSFMVTADYSGNIRFNYFTLLIFFNYLICHCSDMNDRFDFLAFFQYFSFLLSTLEFALFPCFIFIHCDGKELRWFGTFM